MCLIFRWRTLQEGAEHGGAGAEVGVQQEEGQGSEATARGTAASKGSRQRNTSQQGESGEAGGVGGLPYAHDKKKEKFVKFRIFKYIYTY